jgi:hypothetical protein
VVVVVVGNWISAFLVVVRFGGCLVFILSLFVDLSFLNRNKWLRCAVARAPILRVLFLAGYMGMGVVVFKLGMNFGGSGGGVVDLASLVCD